MYATQCLPSTQFLRQSSIDRRFLVTSASSALFDRSCAQILHASPKFQKIWKVTRGAAYHPRRTLSQPTF